MDGTADQTTPQSDDQTTGRPTTWALSTLRPNPFRQNLTVDFAVPHALPVTLGVYDSQGRLVRWLTGGARPPGRYSLSWDGRTESGAPAAAGVYLVRLQSREAQVERKAILLR